VEWFRRCCRFEPGEPRGPRPSIGATSPHSELGGFAKRVWMNVNARILVEVVPSRLTNLPCARAESMGRRAGLGGAFCDRFRAGGSTRISRVIPSRIAPHGGRGPGCQASRIGHVSGSESAPSASCRPLFGWHETVPFRGRRTMVRQADGRPGGRVRVYPPPGARDSCAPAAGAFAAPAASCSRYGSGMPWRWGRSP